MNLNEFATLSIGILLLLMYLEYIIVPAQRVKYEHYYLNRRNREFVDLLNRIEEASGSDQLGGYKLPIMIFRANYDDTETGLAQANDLESEFERRRADLIGIEYYKK